MPEGKINRARMGGLAPAVNHAVVDHPTDPGDESHAGIPHFLRNQFREVACDLLADALSAAGFDILHKKFFQR